MYLDSIYLLYNWENSITKGSSQGRELGNDRYIEIYYEELVRNTTPTMKLICEFLNEDYHPNMSDHTNLSKQIISTGGHVEVREPISDTRVFRWKSQMSQFDIKIANRIAGNTLQDHHYEIPILNQFTFVEKLIFILLMIRYHFFWTIRKLLYQLGLITLNRKKRKR